MRFKLIPFLLFAFILFGCVDESSMYVRIYENTHDFLRLDKNTFLEYAGINKSEIIYEIIDAVEIIDGTLVINTSTNTTLLAFQLFKKFQPLFGVNESLKEIERYKNKTIFEINNKSIGFFLENNLLYIGKIGGLKRIIDGKERIIGLPASDFVVYKREVSSISEEESLLGYGNIDGNVVVGDVIVQLRSINANTTQIARYYDPEKIRKYYFELFNSKSNIIVKDVKVEKNKVILHLVADYKELLKVVGNNGLSRQMPVPTPS